MLNNPPRSRSRLRTLVGKALGAHGFVSQGSRFFRFRGDFVQVVYLQGSRFAMGKTYLRSHFYYASEPPAKIPDEGYHVLISASDSLDAGDHPCLAMDLPADASWSQQVSQALTELVANLDELSTLEQVLAENAKPRVNGSGRRASVMQSLRERLLREKGLRVP